MTPYKRYLADGALPVEPEEGKKVKRNAARYTLVHGVLFRHGFTHPILTCVSGDECARIMAELHEGICGSHVGGRSLASKVFLANSKRGLRATRPALQAMAKGTRPALIGTRRRQKNCDPYIARGLFMPGESTSWVRSHWR